MFAYSVVFHSQEEPQHWITGIKPILCSGSDTMEILFKYAVLKIAHT